MYVIFVLILIYSFLPFFVETSWYNIISIKQNLTECTRLLVALTVIFFVCTLFRSREYTRKGSLEVTFFRLYVCPQILRNSILIKLIMGHLYGAQVNRK